LPCQARVTAEGTNPISPLDAKSMYAQDLQIRLEQPDDEPILSRLSAEAFGPGRFARSAYRVREGVKPIAPLCLTGWLGPELIGGIRFTAIEIGGKRGGVLLGPLVVAPWQAGQGYGKALVEEGIARSKTEGFSLVLLVGDVPYYGRFGFAPVPPGQVALPGPVDPQRVLALELERGTLSAMRGEVRGYALPDTK
jgi:predicted N-acetyltransferase YhbS